MKQKLKILILLGGVLVASCNKEHNPQSSEKSAPAQIRIIESEPGGDDDDEQIIIRGKVVNYSGAPTSNAELHLFNSVYSTYGITGANGDVDLVAPDTGMYIYEIRINNALLHADTMHYTQPLTCRTDTL